MDRCNKLFGNVSEVFSKKELTSLGWQGFLGSTREFRALSGKLSNSEGAIKEEYIGPEGYALFADEHFDGKMQKTFL